MCPITKTSFVGSSAYGDQIMVQLIIQLHPRITLENLKEVIKSLTCWVNNLTVKYHDIEKTKCCSCLVVKQNLVSKSCIINYWPLFIFVKINMWFIIPLCHLSETSLPSTGARDACCTQDPPTWSFGIDVVCRATSR